MTKSQLPTMLLGIGEIIETAGENLTNEKPSSSK